MMKTLGKSLALMFALSAGGCVVVADTYEECVVDNDCFSSDYCQPYESDDVSTAICTQPCFSNNDCPTTASGFAGVCLPIGAGDACVEACQDDFDCQTGFRCEQELLTGFDYLICVPRF